MAAMTWSYAYSLKYGSFAPCDGCVSTKTVTITDPVNIFNTYGTGNGIDEGLLLSRGEGPSGSTSLRSDSKPPLSSSFPMDISNSCHLPINPEVKACPHD